MGFWHFDDNKYRKEIRCWGIPRLEHEWQTKTAKYMSLCVGTGAGIGFARMTAGLSLIGSAYGARQANITLQQIKILEARIIEKTGSNPTVRKRDLILGATIGAATAGIAHVVPIGADHLIGHALSSTAAPAVSNATHHLTSAGVNHTMNGMTHGAHDALVSQGHNLTSSNPSGTSWISTSNYGMVVDPSSGYGLGVAGVRQGETELLKNLAKRVGDREMERRRY